MTRAARAGMCLAAGSVVYLGAGCAMGDGGIPVAIVRDSAGVRIVETARPAAPEPVPLDETPAIEIGVLEGDPAYQFYRVTGLVRLPDGRVVVANAGTQEVRYYDADGRHLVTVGGEGAGPGEFVRLDGIAHVGGDTVVAFDPETARLTYFTGAGDLVASSRVWSDDQHRAEWMELGGALAEGLVFVPGRLRLTRGPGTHIDTTRVLLLERDSTGAAWREIFADPYVQFTARASEMPSGQTAVSLTSPVFTTPPAVAIAGAHVALGSSDRHQVELRDAAGRLVQIARYALPRQPITDALMDSAIDAHVAVAPEGQARFVRIYFENAPRPDSLPAREDILMAASGIVWLKHFDPMPRHEGRWTVFDASGAVRCEVVTPVGFEPVWLDDELLLGVHEDDLGVERVRGYRVAELHRPAACPVAQ